MRATRFTNSAHKVMAKMCRLEEKVVELNGALPTIIQRLANGGSLTFTFLN
jgi:hypothetical protein